MQARSFPHTTDQSPTDYIDEDMASTFRQAKELRDEFTSRHHTVSQHYVYVTCSHTLIGRDGGLKAAIGVCYSLLYINEFALCHQLQCRIRIRYGIQ